jgi:hypothetical protein
MSKRVRLDHFYHCDPLVSPFMPLSTRDIAACDRRQRLRYRRRNFPRRDPRTGRINYQAAAPQRRCREHRSGARECVEVGGTLLGSNVRKALLDDCGRVHPGVCPKAIMLARHAKCCPLLRRLAAFDTQTISRDPISGVYSVHRARCRWR